MYAYVGCRTTRERKARGKGINVYRVDDTGTWIHVQLVVGQSNPSYLIFDRTQNFLYCVHGDFSEVSAFKVDRLNGTLTALNNQSTEGRNPVHLAVDGTNGFVIVANYATGTLALLPKNNDGTLETVCDRVQLLGNPGPHRTEQKGSHPHQVLFDPTFNYFLVPDKGLDKVFVLRLDAAARKLVLNEDFSLSARQGAAPRHAGFHPTKPYIYVANELDSSVSTCTYDPVTGRLRAVEVVSTLPSTCVTTSHAAGIQITPDGRHVYISNRGDDSITGFAIDPQASTLRALSWTKTNGRKPRFITLDPCGRTLYAANEDTDTIVGFSVDSRSGALSATGQVISTGSPVCIAFLAERSTNASASNR